MTTLKQSIIQDLEGRGYVFEGVLEQEMRDLCGSKGGTTSRVARFLRKDGILESTQLEAQEGKKYLAWRIKPQTTPQTAPHSVVGPKLVLNLKNLNLNSLAQNSLF